MYIYIYNPYHLSYHTYTMIFQGFFWRADDISFLKGSYFFFKGNRIYIRPFTYCTGARTGLDPSHGTIAHTLTDLRQFRNANQTTMSLHVSGEGKESRIPRGKPGNSNSKHTGQRWKAILEVLTTKPPCPSNLHRKFK